MTATRFPLTSYTSPRCPLDNGLQEYKLWFKKKLMASLNFLRPLRGHYMLQRSSQRIECTFCRQVKLQKPQMAYSKKKKSIHQLTEIMVTGRLVNGIWEESFLEKLWCRKELTATSKGNHPNRSLPHFQRYMWNYSNTKPQWFSMANPTHLEQS